MTVVDIHPEDLIDKLNAGSINATERERLDAHLARCAACRFEITVQGDFAEEAPLLDARPQLGFEPKPQAPREQKAAPAMRVRRRRRWPLVAIAAAFVLCAGGATAAVVAGAVAAPHWLPWVPEASPSVAPGTTASASAKNKAKPKATVAKAELPVVAAVEPVASAVAPVLEREREPAEHDAPKAARPLAPRPASTPLSAERVVAAPPSEPVRATVEPAAALFADANRARRDGNVERAVVLYRSLQSRFPSSPESELSRALLAQLLLERGSPEAALAGFDRYLADGSPVLGAEAFVGRARALEQLGKPAQAVTAWRAVQTRFPGSVHARLAATRLAALGER
jgi:TolA-binding protein